MDNPDDLISRLQRALGDGFQIERELARGGMSQLFLATERSLNRSVVVKVLPPEAMDGISADRFQRESALLARLQHPHIVPVLSAGRNADVAYYIMPFVEGESLATRLARDGPFDVASGVALIREIADALGHAHSLGVVHRDVKPANVLLAAGHAVVSDFGIAHVDTSQVTRLTATGLGLGTVGYMAPEQIVGASNVDARADIFALGVVGYELLTGRSPFATSTGAAAFAPQLHGKPVHPRGVRAEIPVAAGDALIKALEIDPNARFQTMAEFRGALGSVSAGRFGKRGPIAAGAAILVAAAVIAAFVVKSGDQETAVTTSPAGIPQPVQRARPAAPARPIVSLIAVAPFDVLRGDLAVWREGMVDILSRNLDGMGDLRTISPTTVLQSWRGRSDAASAAALGKTVRAQVVIYGALRGDGDSVRAVATLFDVVTGQPIADVERRDAPNRVDRLADSLTVEIVRALGGPRGRGPYLGSVGTRSMPALKAFLQGERYFRRSAYDSADMMFRRATEIDTAFALAYHGQARALGWIPNYPQRIVAARAAAARNRGGLSEHDSLSIVLGAMDADRRSATSNSGALLARGIATVKKFMERYPADGEFRYIYGDIVFHNQSKEVEPLSPREQLALFERSIAADSGLGEAYTHAIQFAMMTRDVPRLNKFFTAIEGNSRITGLSRTGRVLRWFTAAPGRTAAECDRWADTVAISPQLASDVRLGLIFWVDSAGSAAKCLEVLAKRQADRDPGGSVRVGLLAAPLVRGRGLLSRASALDPNRESAGAVGDVAVLAMAGLFDPDSAAALVLPFAADPSLRGAQIRTRVWPFWAWRRDTAAIATGLATERRLRARQGFSPEEFDRVLDVLDKALHALVRGDTSTAIRVIEAAPHLPALEELTLRTLILPTLYEGRGKVREARALLERPHPLISPLHWTLLQIRIGQLSERLGERDRAAAAYSYVLDAFTEAEPQFARFTREAMDGLRRTGDTRARTLVPKP